MHLLKPLIFLAVLLSFNASAETITWLTNKDFANGTYLIDKPGIYKLAENITFNPRNPRQLKRDAYHSSFPERSQFKPKGPYDRAFHLGFFAAIVVTADHVTIDLNGYTLKQSREHALLQRFFALIETASKPFLSMQGPADFGSKIKPANHLTIRNGTLGLSSHHGIHGNNNKYLTIENINFKNYEVAAISLNGVQNLTIRNVKGLGSRRDVPVLGTFSSAQFIKHYVDYLARLPKSKQPTLKVQGKVLSTQDIQQALVKAINNVHHDVMRYGAINRDKHPKEYALFHNKERVVDGNAYGILVNKNGFAVNGFPFRPKPEPGKPIESSQNIVIENVHINNHVANVKEIIAINRNGPVLDPVGAVFQIKNLSPDGQPVTLTSLNPEKAQYKGNVVANAQALVAKAVLQGLFAKSPVDVTRSNISSDIIDWIEHQTALSTLIPKPESGFLCNGDSMFHVNKGVVGFKLDADEDISVKNVSIKNMTNFGEAGSRLCGNDYGGDMISHGKASLKGYGGSRTRGLSLSGSSRASLENIHIENLTAKNGDVIGFDIFNHTARIFMKNTQVTGLYAGKNFKNHEISPTNAPDAIGYQISKGCASITITDYCANTNTMQAFNKRLSVLDKSGHARLANKRCR